MNYYPNLSRSNIYTLSIVLLTMLGFLIRLYMAHIDPFLHIWDERFHALVARNMIEHPFKPMLRSQPVFPADITNWTQSHIWLHKQPLFLAQISLSLKLFGITEYAVRYPSVLMGTFMIPMVYQIVRYLSRHRSIALLSAALFCFSNFHLELVAGIRSMDHNDIALQWYTLASVWSWIRYEQSKKWHWVVLTGLFAGAAILVKWLIGLFIFLIWGLKTALTVRRRIQWRSILAFLIALLICCIVFIPWQIYILHAFPREAAYEYTFNKRHITETLEGHSGNAFFFLKRFPQLFGEGIFLLIFPGIYLCFRSKVRRKDMALPIALGALFVFSFWSFIVQTKVVSHIFFIAPFVFMYMAYSLRFVLIRLRKIYLVLPFLIGVWVLSAKPEKIIGDQSSVNEERNYAIKRALFYKQAGPLIPSSIQVVVNVSDCPSFMFYNKRIMAYETLSPEQLHILQQRKVYIAALENDYATLPDYLRHYPFLYLIPINP